MNHRDLRYFLLIAECKHIGLAAERSHRTQPALTSCVRRLEAHFRVKLIEPEGRGIKLTEAGHALMRWAQRMLANEFDAFRELEELGAGTAGEVRLGIIPAASYLLLPGLCRQVARDMPGVKLATTIETGDKLIALLESGQLNMVVLTQRHMADSVQACGLGHDHIVVVGSESHPIDAAHAAEPRDLLSFPWILQPVGSPTRDWLEQRFLSLNLPSPHIQLESNMLPMLSLLISDSNLLGFVSRHHVRKSPGLREIAAPALIMRRQFSIATRKDAYLSPAETRVYEACKSIAANLIPAAATAPT